MHRGEATGFLDTPAGRQEAVRSGESVANPAGSESSRPPDLSVVVPVYNEEETLPELVRQLEEVLGAEGVSFEIVFVDDGSRDRSADLIRSFQRDNEGIRLLRLSRNFGHQAALTAGLDHAAGRAVVLMDGDLQDPPRVVSALLERWREGAEIVCAVKRRRGEGRLRRLLFAAFYRVIGLVSDVELTPQSGIFSLMDRCVVDHLKALPERNRYLSGLRTWVGFRQAMVEFDRPNRYAGEPRQTLRRLFGLGLDGIFSFSKAPLRLATVFGFLVSAVAFPGSAVIVYLRLFTDAAIPGWASTMTAIAFLGGVQLISLGIIGEYVGRIYDEVKKRPLYILRSEEERRRGGPGGPAGEGDAR